MAGVIHFVYPCGPGIKAPWTIGRHVSRILREHGYVVRNYDWDGGPMPYPTSNDDVLLGHPHPEGHTFISALRCDGWRKKVALAPLVTDGRCDWALPALKRCDATVMIAGEYWLPAGHGSARRGSAGQDKTRQGSSPWDHVPGLTRVDMAITASDLPLLERTWNPPDKRRVAYIGCGLREKGIEYLAEIDAHLKYTETNGGRFVWFWGVDFSTPQGRRDLASCDFVIAPGTSDANPTTIIEAMAWGLVPIATPRSGYSDTPGVLRIPNDDAVGAARAIWQYLRWKDEYLDLVKAWNRRRAEQWYTWSRFCEPILEALR